MNTRSENLVYYDECVRSVKQLNALYLSSFLHIGISLSVLKIALQESSAFLKESDVASMMSTSGVLPHALHKNPSD